MFAMDSRRKGHGGRLAAGSRDASARLAMGGGSGQVIAINVKWLGAFLFGFLAWLMWVEDGYTWWQFRLLSLLMLWASVLTAVDALKATGQYLQRRKLLDEAEAIDGRPKGSRLADSDDLDRAGMR